MKKIVSSVLVASLAATSLAACGGSSTAPATTTAAAKETATTEAAKESAATEAAKESTGDAVTLKWALWDASSITYYQPLIDAYKAEHPNVDIEMVDLGSTDYSTVLGTQLSGSGSDFDVVTIKDVPGYMTLVNKGVLEPLDDKIKEAGIDLSQYGGITDQVKINDALYELPFRSDIWVLYYNKDVFDKAGVDYPTNDMTWDQYDELARKVTDTTPGSEVYGAHYHTWRSTIQLDGILDGKNTIVGGNYDFTKPYYEMVLKQQQDGVCMDYATLKTQGLHYSDAFAQGNVAMMNMGSWFISTLINKVASGEYTDCANWGMVKYPHAEGVEPGSTLATITALALPTSAPHKDEAWDFIQFVTGEQGAQVLAETGNIPAMTNDNIVNAIASMDGFPQDENSKEALVTSHTFLEMPANEKSSEIETVLNEQHDLIMTESSTIDEAVQAMNEGVQAVIG
ncbi:ABC transporter substrate-binding protein [Oribacterium sp. WCC10]|uniref:ABC transporter substrate-binding protein n=1 Tax=Oribacterium sp. WCC10 TaxID=1855343 RepID=UPI0008F212AC|nr:sugar ABC transporter substrate-binding protein [Oribacterium sp. WCC10]SFG51026.1 carbohydrate ABC transporter substrate-binding protein, CUT1 family [Oribacterium sp. WCC10]